MDPQGKHEWEVCLIYIGAAENYWVTYSSNRKLIYKNCHNQARRAPGHYDYWARNRKRLAIDYRT